MRLTAPRWRLSFSLSLSLYHTPYLLPHYCILHFLAGVYAHGTGVVVGRTHTQRRWISPQNGSTPLYVCMCVISAQSLYYYIRYCCVVITIIYSPFVVISCSRARACVFVVCVCVVRARYRTQMAYERYRLTSNFSPSPPKVRRRHPARDLSSADDHNRKRRRSLAIQYYMIHNNSATYIYTYNNIMSYIRSFSIRIHCIYIYIGRYHNVSHNARFVHLYICGSLVMTRPAAYYIVYLRENTFFLFLLVQT